MKYSDHQTKYIGK